MRAVLALRGWRKDRRGQLRAIKQSVRQRNAAHRTGGAILFPPRPGQIAARYTLNGKHNGAFDQHGSACKLICVRLQRGRELAHVSGDEMIGHNVLEQVKPEQRDLREDFAFARNAGCEHMIESRDAVRGDHEQRIANCVKIAHLAASEQGYFAEIRFEQCGHGRALPWRELNLRFSSGRRALSMYEVKQKAFECSASTSPKSDLKGKELRPRKKWACGYAWSGEICTAHGVMAVTDPPSLLGDTSIVNIGSESEYESSLRAGCHEAAVERGSRG